MPIGTVKFFNDSKGYGFIAPDQGGNDAFVHISAVERAGMRSLSQNQRLSYELEQDNRGKTSAVNLQSAEQAEQAPQPAEQPVAQAEEAAQPEPEQLGDQAEQRSE